MKFFLCHRIESAISSIIEVNFYIYKKAFVNQIEKGASDYCHCLVFYVKCILAENFE